MNKVYLGLGSNIENRLKYLSDAIKLIEESIGSIVKKSSVYETEPWGKTDQSVFLNIVICVNSKLSPDQLLNEIFAIENILGRVRIEKWGEREIDIDILFYNDQVLYQNNLVIPHPYIQERQFVLVPLNEIAHDLYHPVLKSTIRKLLLMCPDKSKINKYSSIES